MQKPPITTADVSRVLAKKEDALARVLSEAGFGSTDPASVFRK